LIFLSKYLTVVIRIVFFEKGLPVVPNTLIFPLTETLFPTKVRF